MRLFFFAVLSCFTLHSWSNDALTIATAIDAQVHDFSDQQAQMTMVLIDASGREAVRSMQVKSLALEGEERTLMVFDKPHDVAGTAFLSFTLKQGDSKQWLYLPAIKRVKSISTRTKSGPFMGSEFAYEDIITPFMEQFEYRYDKQEACGDQQCHVLWRTPKDPYSGYSQEQVWADTEHHLIQRIDYYDRKGELVKTYTATDFQQYDNHWRPLQMEMHNHRTHKKTRLTWEGFLFDQGLNERAFTENALKRSR